MHGLGHVVTGSNPVARPQINMKYNERQIIQHLEDYIDSTYSQHYTKGDFQIQDLFEHIDIAEEFCRGAQSNILFVSVEKSKNEKDLLKCLHYVILMYHYCGFDKKLIEETDV